MTDNLHFVFVELSSFKKEWEDIDNDKERLYFCLKRAQLKYAERRGHEKGFAKGREEGREEGETAKQLETARRMKSMGLPVGTICEATGLSQETVSAL